MKFVNALNALHDNLWALVIIGAGVAALKWDRATGGTLITLGAAVFQKRTNGEQPQPPKAA